MENGMGQRGRYLGSGEEKCGCVLTVLDSLGCAEYKLAQLQAIFVQQKSNPQLM
jgi:hypothetical protein